MLLLKLINAALFWAVFEIALFFLYLLAWPSYLFGERGRSFMRFLVKIVLRLIFFCFAIRLDLTGQVRTGKIVLAANNPCLLAPLFLLAVLPARLVIVADAGMKRIPLLGRVMAAMGHIFMVGGGGTLATSRALFQALADGTPLLLFTDERGAEKLARQAGAAVQQLTISGSEQVMPKESALVLPGRITVTPK
jgi:1-acyl-sn-glycerol-3-phosphate acyltransferase